MEEKRVPFFRSRSPIPFIIIHAPLLTLDRHCSIDFIETERKKESFSFYLTCKVVDQLLGKAKDSLNELEAGMAGTLAATGNSGGDGTGGDPAAAAALSQEERMEIAKRAAKDATAAVTSIFEPEIAAAREENERLARACALRDARLESSEPRPALVVLSAPEEMEASAVSEVLDAMVLAGSGYESKVRKISCSGVMAEVSAFMEREWDPEVGADAAFHEALTVAVQDAVLGHGELVFWLTDVPAQAPWRGEGGVPYPEDPAEMEAAVAADQASQQTHNDISALLFTLSEAAKACTGEWYERKTKWTEEGGGGEQSALLAPDSPPRLLVVLHGEWDQQWIPLTQYIQCADVETLASEMGAGADEDGDESDDDDDEEEEEEEQEDEEDDEEVVEKDEDGGEEEGKNIEVVSGGTGAWLAAPESGAAAAASAAAAAVADEDDEAFHAAATSFFEEADDDDDEYYNGGDNNKANAPSGNGHGNNNGNGVLGAGTPAFANVGGIAEFTPAFLKKEGGDELVRVPSRVARVAAAAEKAGLSVDDDEI